MKKKEKPYVKKFKYKSKLFFNIIINKEKKKIWFEVDNKYAEYLCDDRVDAIVVGLLHYAMKNNHNIQSNSYITEELLYKIKTFLIPTLTKYDKRMHNINIDIKTKPACENAGGVGTGCSCGVDSLYSYLSNNKTNIKQFKLTHLCINSVGAFNETYKDEGVEKVKNERYKKSIEFAKEVNLPLIITNSNFLEEIYQVHYYTHTYSSTFTILCLQNLWKTYYYGSSGCDFSTFSVYDNAEHDCANYELLSLNCFSTNNLIIYSDGGAKDRLEKTKYIYKDKLTKKYLHVCLKKAYNCGICDKCRRTLLSLYALGANIEEYNNIFDTKYFLKNKEEYFDWIYKEHIWNNEMIESIYEMLKNDKDFKNYLKKQEDRNKNDLIDYKKEYEKIINSKSFKLGNAIMKIPRKIKRIINK